MEQVNPDAAVLPSGALDHATAGPPPSRRACDPPVLDCPHVRSRAEDGKQWLDNLLTGESQELICCRFGVQEVQFGKFALCVTNGEAHVWYQADHVGSAKVLLETSVYDADGRFYTASRDGTLAWLQCGLQPAHFKFFEVPFLSEGRDFNIKVYKLPCRALGAEWWFDLQCFHAWQPWGSYSRAQQMQNMIRNVKTLGIKLGLSPSALCMVGGQKSFHSPLEAAALSSTGVLCALLCLCSMRDNNSAIVYKRLLVACVKFFLSIAGVPFRLSEDCTEKIDVTSQCLPTPHAVQCLLDHGKVDDSPS